MAERMTERIEDRLSAVPWAQAAASGGPPLLEKFLTELLPRFAFPETTSGVLDAFSGLDVKSEELALLLERNPYYEHQFRRFIESMGKREHTPSVVATVVLLGMTRSRDLILSLQMHRTITGEHVPWSSEGKLAFKPSELLVYASKTDDPLFGNREPWATGAFTGGFLLDWTVYLAKTRGADAKVLGPFADSIFNHGQRTAKVAVALSSLLPELGFRRFLYSACLVHDVGKIAMAMLDPSYVEFHADMETRVVSRGVRLFTERARFGVSHEMLGAAICEVSGAFKPVSRAVLFHHEPALLKKEGGALYLFAGLLAFSSNVANYFKKPEKDETSHLARWKSPELKDFPLDMKKAEPLIVGVISNPK